MVKEHTGSVWNKIEIGEHLVLPYCPAAKGLVRIKHEGQYFDYEATYELMGMSLNHRELDYFLTSVKKLPSRA